MAFHEDPGVREEAPKAAGPRFFFRIIAQQAAALLKLNLLFLLFCLPADHPARPAGSVPGGPPDAGGADGALLEPVLGRLPSSLADGLGGLPSDGPAPDGGRVRGMVLSPLRPE